MNELWGQDKTCLRWKNFVKLCLNIRDVGVRNIFLIETLNIGVVTHKRTFKPDFDNSTISLRLILL
jgi:hypothetical protein